MARSKRKKIKEEIELLKKELEKDPLPSKQKKTITDLMVNFNQSILSLNEKIDEIRKMDPGSKILTIAGWLIVCFSGTIMIYLVMIDGFVNICPSEMPYCTLVRFGGFFLMFGGLMLGYALAHKGLTGYWL